MNQQIFPYLVQMFPVEYNRIVAWDFHIRYVLSLCSLFISRLDCTTKKKIVILDANTWETNRCCFQARPA